MSGFTFKEQISSHHGRCQTFQANRDVTSSPSPSPLLQVVNDRLLTRPTVGTNSSQLTIAIRDEIMNYDREAVRGEARKCVPESIREQA
jgi:hypothetical protein